MLSDWPRIPWGRPVDSALLASDMHLDDADPAITQWFVEQLQRHLKPGELLVLLGDLFEVWIGDDDPSAASQSLAQIMRRHVEAGGLCAIMHGNRDFLIGPQFCEAAGAVLLPDPCVTQIANQTVLLAHGDAFCTDDLEYQAIRKQARTPEWQADFLARPLAERREFARSKRELSERHKSGLDAQIMDVNAACINDLARTMNDHHLTLLIHGHTHRPATHRHDTIERWVLPDWKAGESPRGGFLRVSNQGVRRVGHWAQAA